MLRRIVVFTLCTVALAALAVLFMSRFTLLPQAVAPSEQGEPGFGLRLPPFMGTVHAAPASQNSIADYFASGVAGMSAYTNLGKAIDVDKLADSDLFEVIEDSQTGEYVIGTVTVSGFKDNTKIREYMQAHVFVHREGWIVSYLTPNEIVAQIIDWSAYATQKLNTTSLEDIINQVARTTGNPVDEIGYYHFSYPDATDLILVGDALEREGRDSFSIKIPTGISVYDSSFSSAGYKAGFECYFNDEEISDMLDYGDWTLWRGTISPTKWSTVSPDNITIRVHNPGAAYCGIAILYGAEQ